MIKQVKNDPSMIYKDFIEYDKFIYEVDRFHRSIGNYKKYHNMLKQKFDLDKKLPNGMPIVNVSYSDCEITVHEPTSMSPNHKTRYVLRQCDTMYDF